ncbi:MAG: DNA primase [Sphingomonas sp.]|uniref:DNA primase n=1 Tax=Sphingomonas sp. TaxID=28214 RepID=UPI001ACBF9D1|nr:DNA primase [Sphingomonas sp.]MBN8808171.1 DNA primase [Sphingomonas sp.]
MGGYQVHSHGTGDDGYDEEGYDESQRAEILEATRDGPTDGNLITDLQPDLGDDPENDDVTMNGDDVGEEDDDAGQTATAIDEDEVQDELDDDSVGNDELTDADDEALNP